MEGAGDAVGVFCMVGATVGFFEGGEEVEIGRNVGMGVGIGVGLGIGLDIVLDVVMGVELGVGLVVGLLLIMVGEEVGLMVLGGQKMVSWGIP